MGRLPGFDYKRPFFYMVTLKGARSALCKTPFCAISEKCSRWWLMQLPGLSSG